MWRIHPKEGEFCHVKRAGLSPNWSINHTIAKNISFILPLYYVTVTVVELTSDEHDSGNVVVKPG